MSQRDQTYAPHKDSTALTNCSVCPNSKQAASTIAGSVHTRQRSESS